MVLYAPNVDEINAIAIVDILPIPNAWTLLKENYFSQGNVIACIVLDELLILKSK